MKFNLTCFGQQNYTSIQYGYNTLRAMKFDSAEASTSEVIAVATDAATSGNQFRVTGSDWHFNLATKALGNNASAAQGTWLLEATLFDGSKHTVWVAIKK